jgi:hypothetical protein
VKPREEQGNCIISEQEMEMALRRMMREQFSAAEPATQSWQKLHNRIVAAAPIDARQEVQARVINNPLAWVNIFAPRILQVTFAVVFMLATVLNAGVGIGDFSHHQYPSSQEENANSINIILDDRTTDPPVKNDPNLNRQLETMVAERQAKGSNKVDEAEHVRPQTYTTLDAPNPRAEQRGSGDYMLQ